MVKVEVGSLFQNFMNHIEKGNFFQRRTMKGGIKKGLGSRSNPSENDGGGACLKSTDPAGEVVGGNPL